MKKSHAGNQKLPEETFSAALVVVLLLILPQIGAVAMVGGSAVGMGAYVYLFPNRFRNRKGSLAPGLILIAVLAALAAGILIVSLVRGW